MNVSYLIVFAPEADAEILYGGEVVSAGSIEAAWRIHRDPDWPFREDDDAIPFEENTTLVRFEDGNKDALVDVDDIAAIVDVEQVANPLTDGGGIEFGPEATLELPS